MNDSAKTPQSEQTWICAFNDGFTATLRYTGDGVSLGFTRLPKRDLMRSYRPIRTDYRTWIRDVAQQIADEISEPICLCDIPIPEDEHFEKWYRSYIQPIVSYFDEPEEKSTYDEGGGALVRLLYREVINEVSGTLFLINYLIEDSAKRKERFRDLFQLIIDETCTHIDPSVPYVEREELAREMFKPVVDDINWAVAKIDETVGEFEPVEADPRDRKND